MKNKVLFLAAIAIVVATGWWLIKNPTSKTRIPTPTSPAISAESSPNTLPQNSNGQTPDNSPASSVVVSYTDNGYSPSPLSIKVGSTVIFKNNSSRALWTASDFHPTHTVYDGTSLSQHCANPSITTFDQCSSSQPGQEWSFTFTKPGTWNYHNHTYPADTGTIVVEE